MFNGVDAVNGVYRQADLFGKPKAPELFNGKPKATELFNGKPKATAFEC